MYLSSFQKTYWKWKYREQHRINQRQLRLEWINRNDYLEEESSEVVDPWLAVVCWVTLSESTDKEKRLPLRVMTTNNVCCWRLMLNREVISNLYKLFKVWLLFKNVVSNLKKVSLHIIVLYYFCNTLEDKLPPLSLSLKHTHAHAHTHTCLLYTSRCV